MIWSASSAVIKFLKRNIRASSSNTSIWGRLPAISVTLSACQPAMEGEDESSGGIE
jgi:hypothetical protein